MDKQNERIDQINQGDASDQEPQKKRRRKNSGRTKRATKQDSLSESGLDEGSVPSPTTNPNPHALADLSATDADIRRLLDEPIPADTVEATQREQFIRRQYQGEQFTAKLNALFQWRMGTVLLSLKREKPHGQWETYLAKTFSFSARTAVNYMAIARETSQQEAQAQTAQDLLIKLGMVKAGSGSVSDVLEKAVTKLKGIWKSVLGLAQINSQTMTALRRVKSSDPAFEVIKRTIAEIKLSLDSLLADVEERQRIAAGWDSQHSDQSERGAA